MAALNELERAVEELEEKKKKEKSKEEFEKVMEYLNSNLRFAERLSLVSTEQVYIYRKRIENASIEFRRREKREKELIANNESAKEQVKRFEKMDDARAAIASERNEKIEQKNQRNQARSAVGSSSVRKQTMK